MKLVLAHHGDAVGPEVDIRRPLSDQGRAAVERLAVLAAEAGASPSLVWHSGKLRAKQTAEIYWRACNALAQFSATRDLQPDDPPVWMRDRLRHEPRDLLIAGHYPHLPGLLRLLAANAAGFPIHGVVALETTDEGETWRELWRFGG